MLDSRYVCVCVRACEYKGSAVDVVTHYTVYHHVCMSACLYFYLCEDLRITPVSGDV